jgi:hypothetical protein
MGAARAQGLQAQQGERQGAAAWQLVAQQGMQTAVLHLVEEAEQHAQVANQ